MHLKFILVCSVKYGLRKRTLKNTSKQISLSKCGQSLYMKSIWGSESSLRIKAGLLVSQVISRELFVVLIRPLISLKLW